MKKNLLYILFIILLTPILFAENIPAYYTLSYESPKDVVLKLKEAGFKIIFEYQIGKKKELHSILFTNNLLTQDANKKGRAFGSILRLLVDGENNIINIDNPIYFEKAFLQDDYNKATANTTLKSLKKVFGNLRASLDQLEDDNIADYHFMIGMPYYEDMIVLAYGKHKKLLRKLRSYNNGKNFLFDFKLSENRYIVGYKLNNEIVEFPKKIGYQNSQLLPYLILIEDEKAQILDPKYYLAISYPLLSFFDFTSIANLPRDIEMELRKPFEIESNISHH